jgi:hypothetical protein
MNSALIRYLLFVTVVAAAVTLDSITDKAKSFWRSAAAYPVLAVIVAALLFICCCAIPKILKIAVFAAVACTAGYFAYDTFK